MLPVSSLVEASARAEAGGVVFSVRDQGTGVPQELRGRLFERFRRGRQPGEGVGLGLSISKALVESHGGRIWIEDAPGGGSIFSFRIGPAAQRAPARA